jgi:hypothetical protein
VPACRWCAQLNGKHRGEVYYRWGSETVSNGDRLEYGGKGKAVGPATGESHKGKGLAVQFPGNKSAVSCLFTQLSLTPPPTDFKGGYRHRGVAYWEGESRTIQEGYRVEYGMKGEVMGPATAESVKGKGLNVQFPGNKGPIDCRFTELSLTPPPTDFEGGYRYRGVAYYEAESKTWEHAGSTYRLEYGMKGEVMGLATLESHKGKGLAVQFPGNTGPIDCYFTSLSLTPPPTDFEGGFRIPGEVYYKGKPKTWDDGDRVDYGGKGTAVGTATLESHKGKGLAVQFPGNKTAIGCFFTELSLTDPKVREPPPTTTTTASLSLSTPPRASLSALRPPTCRAASRRADRLPLRRPPRHSAMLTSRLPLVLLPPPLSLSRLRVLRVCCVWRCGFASGGAAAALAGPKL